jgi:hypothetical protein
MKIERSPLVPSKDNVNDVIDLLVDLMGKHKVSIKKMLDNDSLALSQDDMMYFDKVWWGKVPTYGRFIRDLKRIAPEFELELKEIEAEVLGRDFEEELRSIYEKSIDDWDGSERQRFSWGEKLYKMQERRLDRIDKRRGNDGIEKGVDITLKVIEALSNKQLETLKNVMDAEWKVVDGDDRG